MKMNKKLKNRGFSLVELIVVIAVMGILAVTLAPRLTSYIEKTRMASDKEVVNTIMTAVRYGLVDEEIYDAFFDTDVAEETSSGSGIWEYNLKTSGLYEVSSNDSDWNIDDETTPYAKLDNKFVQEIVQVVGDFKLKSNKVGDNTEITITLDTKSSLLTVSLDYDTNDTITTEDDYTVDFQM